MIKHIVLFKVKDNSHINELKNRLLNLKNDIKEIITIEVGTDIGIKDSASDIGLITTFENIDKLKIYANHPKHLEVIEFIKEVTTARSSIDWEF